jgi:tetratricopeptide (TPR) repeat protein
VRHALAAGGMALGQVSSRPPLLGLAVILFATSACDSREERAAKLAQTAQMQAEAGDLAGAAQSIGKAIAERDDLPDYYILQGQIQLSAKNIGQAYNSYKAALALDQSNQEALGLVSNVAFRVGNLEEAADTADRLLALNPQSIPGLQVKALVALQKRQLDDALALADKILLLSPQDEGGMLIRARALALQDKIPDAIEAIDKLVAINGQNISTLSTLANIYRYMQDAGRMREAMKQLVEKSPQDFGFKIDYANLLYKMGAAAEARTVLAGMLSVDVPSVRDYQQVTRLWTEFDNAPLPQPLLDKVAREANHLALDAVLRHFLLVGQYRTGDMVIARMSPENRRRLAPLIGRYQMAAGDRASARAVAASTIENDPGNVDGLLLSAVLDLAGRRAAQAVIHAQTALGNDPLNPDAYIVLAKSHMAKGEAWRARQVMEEGLKRIPQSQYLYDAYLPFLHRQDDGGRAVALARSLTRASPASVRAWDRLGAECRRYDPACVEEALSGRALAQKTYQLDEEPGAAPDRSLFGRL